MTPFCCLFRITKMIYGLRSEQTVTNTVLWCSLKESLFCMEENPFCFKCVRAGILKLLPLLYRHAKVHENAINTMVTCSYKWPTYNICVSSMRFTYSSQDSLFHSESIYIGFKLTTPTVQELCPLKMVCTNKTRRSFDKIIYNCVEKYRYNL